MCNFHLMGYYCSPNLSIHQNSTQERYLVFITSFRKPSNEIIFNSAHVAAKFLCPIRFFSSLSILLSHSFLSKGDPRFKYFIFFQIHLIRPFDLLPLSKNDLNQIIFSRCFPCLPKYRLYCMYNSFFCGNSLYVHLWSTPST